MRALLRQSGEMSRRIGDASKTIVDANPRQGAVYIYEWNGTSWKFATTLLDPDGQSGDLFGCSISLSQDAIVIGSPGMNAGSGGAVVFSHASGRWELEARLTPSDDPWQAFAGTSVAISNSSVAIGAPFDDSYTGAVYLYTKKGSAWFEQKFTSGRRCRRCILSAAR